MATNGSTLKKYTVAGICCLLAVWAATSTGLVGCSGEKSSQTLDIGAILPLSGSLGFMGKMEGDGMSLAAQDINQTGGVKGHEIKIMFEDSQGKPDIAVSAAQRMMDIENVKIITASFSSVALGLKPVIERQGGLLVGACMHPDFYKNSPGVFRFYIGVQDESKGFVDYLTSLKDTKPSPRIGVLYVEAPNVVEQIEDFVEPGLQSAGLEFVVKEPYQLSDKEFRDKILKLRNANITHLLLIGYGFLYPNIFRELEDQQLRDKIEIVGGWGFLYPNVPAEGLDGVVVIGPKYAFEDNEEISGFHERFKKQFGYDANFDAVMTYATVQLIARGCEEAGSDNPERLASALLALKDIPTLVGTVSVDADGAISFPVGIGEYRQGRILETPGNAK